MVRQSSTGRYLVKPHDPWKVWVLRGALASVLLAAGWTFYELGVIHAGYHRAASNAEIQQLTEQLGELQVRLEALTEENVQLSSNTAIEATATQQVNERLDQLNQESLELKEELVFYRSLLSPSELEPGLQILGVQLVKNAKEHSYGYKIVLTQRRNRNRFADGKVEMSITGMLEGESTQLESTNVLADKKGELQFRFKNFQSLEGQLTLPTGFQPQMVLVKVNPRSQRLKKIERNYEWNSIVIGG